jgi:UDPglucose 6-dehydrogenase
MLADLGHIVVCMDVDVARPPVGAGPGAVLRTGLEDLIPRNSCRGRLRFTNDVDAAVSHGMQHRRGTPVIDGAADVRHIFTVARQLSACGATR